MKRWMTILIIATTSWAFAGCGGNSDKPKTDAEGKPVKAPEVPPNGV